MNYSEQLRSARFVAAAFSSQLNNAPLPTRDADLSWISILNMARAHSVLGIVFSAYESVLVNEIPKSVYDACAKEVSILGAKHLKQRAEFFAVTERFTSEKIYFMPLKGFIIKSLYPSSELRAMNDIDILVFKDSFKKAKDALISMGYTAAETSYVHDNFLKPPFIEIELHKMLAVDWEDFSLADSLPSKNNEYWRLLSDEDLFVFVLKHSAKHDSSGGCGMKAVFDFSLLKAHVLEKTDKKSLEKRVIKEGLWEFYSALSYLEDLWLFGGKERPELSVFEIYTVSGGAYGTRSNGISKTIKGGKLRFFLSRLFPSYSNMKKAFPVLKKCPILLPVLYPWRIVRGVFRGSHKRDLDAIRRLEKSENGLGK